MYDAYGRKRIVDWFNETERPEGMNRTGQAFFYEIKDVEKRFSRNNIILFFLLAKCGVEDMRTLMVSSSKQKKLIVKIKIQLKNYGVTQEWREVFRRDIDGFNKRADHVFRIIKENVRLTPLYPYFEAVGFERLVDYSVRYQGGENEQAEQLQKEIEEWNAEHPKEIASHMESVAEEIANRDAHRLRVKEMDRAEKEARRILKRKADAEVREIKRNNKAYASRQRRVEKSFERYYA